MFGPVEREKVQHIGAHLFAKDVILSFKLAKQPENHPLSATAYRGGAGV